MWFSSFLLAVSVALFFSLHTLYMLAAPPLSELAMAFEASTRALPTSTENGYRVQGLLAPAERDPVAYGRCTSRLPNANNAEETSTQEGLARCNQGFSPLSLPPALEQATVSPDWSEQRWSELARSVPDQRLLERAQLIASSGPRHLGRRFDDPVPALRPVMALSLWQTAHATALWKQGRILEAVKAFEAVVDDHLRAADDSLIEAMVAVASLAKTLLALQMALAAGEPMDEATAARLRLMLVSLDSLPTLQIKALDAEWLSLVSAVDSTIDSTTPSGHGGLIEHINNGVSRLMLHRADTLNRMALQHERMKNTATAAAQGQAMQTSGSVPQQNPCAAWGEVGLVCFVFLPNPFGRVMVDVAGDQENAYRSYGTRIADLRNLTAATRLTIEARRRGLTGEALGGFVASAPEGMRDVFTQKAFAYDAEKRKLGIVLREKSPVLGGPGTYELGV